MAHPIRAQLGLVQSEMIQLASDLFAHLPKRIFFLWKCEADQCLRLMQGSLDSSGSTRSYVRPPEAWVVVPSGS